MQLANLSLRSERIGFRKLDNSLCYWREQEPNGANLAFTRPQRPCLPGFIFSVIVVESSWFVISFSAWDLLLSLRTVLCAARGAGELGGWAANLLCHRTPGLALSRVDLRRQLAASSVWFCASLGRQADSTVTCECSLNWLSCLSDEWAGVCCKGFSIASSSARWFSGAGRMASQPSWISL